ncbi:hypothetical protein [Bradyrhizobium sp.]
MADNDKSKIRYDDFISSVQPDPAKPESTIMLSGFVGHGPDGHARVYPDPTLGTWYDIPEGDILHSMPIAESKLGGSHIWVRANAQIKPGSAAPQAAEAAQPAAAVAMNPMNPTPATHCFVCDPPNAAAAMQPTPTVQTHCFICPPHTQAIRCPTQPVVCDTIVPTAPSHCCTPFTPATICTQAVHCPTQPVVCDTMQMPTPATRCFICPPVDRTIATVCTQFGCPTNPVFCNLQPTQPVVCGVLPPSFGCTQGCQQGGGQPQLEAMAAPAHPNTAATLCTRHPACPPHTVHNSMCICPTPSAVHQCGGPAHPTLATVCTLPPGCPPHTVHNSMCICPTPSAVHQCGGQTALCTPNIPQFTVVGACPTFGVCPSIACTFTPVQNGVFTPFGR